MIILQQFLLKIYFIAENKLKITNDLKVKSLFIFASTFI